MSHIELVRIKFVALTVLSSVIAGCAVNTYSTGGPRSNVGLERVLRDPGLASDIKVDAARIDNRAGNQLAQLTLRNAGGSERRIAVRIDWFDASGVNLSGSQNSWRNYTLRAGQVDEVSSVGIPEATDFRASIRNQ